MSRREQRRLGLVLAALHLPVTAVYVDPHDARLLVLCYQLRRGHGTTVTRVPISRAALALTPLPLYAALLADRLAVR